MKNINARVDLHPCHGTARRIYDFEELDGEETWKLAAESMLSKVACLIQVKPDLSQLKFDQVKKSLSGYHVLYQQEIFGKRVSGAWIRVDIDKEGRVYNIINELLPQSL